MYFLHKNHIKYLLRSDSKVFPGASNIINDIAVQTLKNLRWTQIVN